MPAVDIVRQYFFIVGKDKSKSSLYPVAADAADAIGAFDRDQTFTCASLSATATGLW
jgi:hypothetical protein